MRVRMRRRSVSSLVSPGPRVPMPPPRRDSAAPAPTRRGSRYFSWASSTCSLPSRVRARRAKMSRMSWVRSMTFRSSASSRWRSCAGRQLVVEDRRRRRRISAQEAASVSTLPAPRNVEGSGFGPLLQHPQHHVGARGLGQAGELVERALGIEPSARGRRSGRPARRVPRRYASLEPSPNLLPRRSRRRERAPASTPVTSTIVDGGPPGVNAGVEQQRRSRSPQRTGHDRRDRWTPGSPLTLALVAVSGRPHAAQSARATACAGTRTPTRPVPPCHGSRQRRVARTAATSAGRARTARPGAGHRRRRTPSVVSDLRAGRRDERQRLVGAASLGLKHRGRRLGR